MTLDPAWFKKLRAFMGPLPDDYLVLDIETQGWAQSKGTLILEIGWAEVRDRQVVHSYSAVLDWTKQAYGIDQAILRSAIDKTRANMNAKGDSYRFTLECLAEEGVDPAEVLRTARDFCASWQADGGWIAGHNFIRFDRILLERFFTRYAEGHMFPWTRTVDTCLIERCRMLGWEPPLATTAQFDLVDWYDYLIRKGSQSVHCGLQKHCAEAYGLDIDKSKAHSAAYDSICTHNLIEKIRELCER